MSLLSEYEKQDVSVYNTYVGGGKRITFRKLIADVWMIVAFAIVVPKNATI